MTAESVLKKLEDRQVLILGDVMLDRYLLGHVSRISPEAPVPVVLHRETQDRLGGAANVALNIRALGAHPILCSVVGDDADGHALQQMLPAAGMTAEGLIFSKTRKTTVKTRVLGNNQQILRIDQEDSHDLFAEEEQALIHSVTGLLTKYRAEAVIFQDYNKGILTPVVIASILAAARQQGILTTVDPKKSNFFAYQGVDLFKPNLKEMRDSAPFPVQPTLESLNAAAQFLQAQLKHRITMITVSEKGLFLNDQVHGALYPTVARNVADVSGAGDTVISIATLGLVAGLDLPILAVLSNLAGGQVCEYPGVVPVRREILAIELDQWLHQNKFT